MAALVFGELADGALAMSTRHAVTAAARCSSSVDVVLFGCDIAAAAGQAARIGGVRSVRQMESPHFLACAPEDYCPALEALTPHYTHVVATSTSFTRALFPRLAAVLGIAMASDVTAVRAEAEFARTMYAANAVATVRLLDRLKIITVRATAFEPAADASSCAHIEVVAVVATRPSRARISAARASRCGRPDLASARVVVAAGRGLKRAEDFPIIEELADALGGAVGASRPLVDMGYISNEHQVGQTGKVVAPELYIAAGVSGAIQHIAGMKDSKVIVAINSDPDAPIFQYASFGLVGDLYEQVPALTTRIRRLAGSAP